MNEIILTCVEMNLEKMRIRALSISAFSISCNGWSRVLRSYLSLVYITPGNSNTGTKHFYSSVKHSIDKC